MSGPGVSAPDGVCVTSGKGKFFPGGIPVARVSHVVKRELGRAQAVEATPPVRRPHKSPDSSISNCREASRAATASVTRAPDARCATIMRARSIPLITSTLCTIKGAPAPAPESPSPDPKNQAAFFSPPPVSSSVSSRETSIRIPKFWFAARNSTI